MVNIPTFNLKKICGCENDKKLLWKFVDLYNFKSLSLMAVFTQNFARLFSQFYNQFIFRITGDERSKKTHQSKSHFNFAHTCPSISHSNLKKVDTLSKNYISFWITENLMMLNAMKIDTLRHKYQTDDA